MTSEIKAWTEETDKDFIKVVKACFPPSALAIARRMLSNPLRSLWPSAGDIAYENGVPKCVQGAILRKLYIGREGYIGVVGGMLGAEKDASPVSIVNVMKRTIASRGGSVLYFGNTACEQSLKMNRLLGVKERTPVSCSYCRWVPVHWCSLMIYLMRRKVFRQKVSDCKENHEHAFMCKCAKYGVEMVHSFDQGFVDFWACYLKGNRGLVLSRDVDTLKWIFGERLANGEIVALVAKERDKIVGYTLLKPVTSESPKWMIIDIIALHNNRFIIDWLLKAAIEFLRKCSNAISIELFGLNDDIQSSLKRRLPFRRKLPNNFFLYKWQNQGLANDGLSEKLNSLNSWFFGPYDGDMCM